MSLVAFALTSQPIMSLVIAFVMGLSGTLLAGMGNNMVQATTTDAYRGRVMSVWGLLFIGLMPVGQLVARRARVAARDPHVAVRWWRGRFGGGGLRRAAVPAIVNWRGPARPVVDASDARARAASGVTALR